MNLYDGNGTMIPVGGGDSTKSPWLNLSHKGKAPDAYGNSIYSFNRTHEYGLDGTELDLRMTADNVVVVSHDGDVTGENSQGVEQTLTIVSSNYNDLAALTLFTIDGVDYRLLRFDDVARMAFYWGWFLQLDFKSQSNTNACILAAAQIIVDNGLSGKAMYLSGDPDDILEIDPLAIFNIGASTDITGTTYATLPIDRVWRSVNRSVLASFNRDAHPFYVWDAGSEQAETIMGYKPNGIQWQADTDGKSLTDTYLANVDWT